MGTQVQTPLQLNLSPDQISKFNGSNYAVWRLQVVSLLKTLGLFDYCTGIKPCSHNDPDHDRVLYILSVTISDDVLSKILSDLNFSNNARGIWAKLEMKYNPEKNYCGIFL